MQYIFSPSLFHTRARARSAHFSRSLPLSLSLDFRSDSRVARSSAKVHMQLAPRAKRRNFRILLLLHIDAHSEIDESSLTPVFRASVSRYSNGFSAERKARVERELGIWY